MNILRRLEIDSLFARTCRKPGREAGSRGTSAVAVLFSCVVSLAAYSADLGVGNLVYFDENADGAYDAGTDTPARGVAVELYNQGDIPGTSTPVSTTVTAADGSYELIAPVAGNYFVHIPEGEFQNGGNLKNHVSSPGAGGDDAIDDDGDENGIDNLDPASGGISSAVIALALDTEPLDASETGLNGSGDSEDNDFDYTVDFGFIEAAIGNLVWLDADGDGMQDAGEAGIAGVTVTLHDSAGAPITIGGTNPAYADDLSSGDFAGGSYGWPAAGNWIENDVAAINTGPTDGRVRIKNNTITLRNTCDISRVIDLSCCTSASVSFTYRRYNEGWEVADEAYLEYFDGVAWVESAPLWTITGGDDLGGGEVDSAPVASGSLNLPVEATRIRFRTGDSNSGSEWIAFDDIEITCSSPVVAAEAVTDGKGFYYFGACQGVEPSTAYQVRIDTTQAPLAGLALTSQDAGGVTSNDPAGDDSDSDASQSGDEAVLPLTSPASGVNPGFDFGFESAKGDTFASWQALNPLGGENGALDNPDGDIFDNGLEYAFCLDPESGVPGHGEFSLVKEADGSVNAQFMRRQGGLSDVTYTLEAADTLGTPTVWTDVVSISPTINTTDPDVPAGAEKVVYNDIQTATELSSPASGVVRLRVEVDADASGTITAGEIHYTKIFGWQCVDYNDYQCATCSTPFSQDPVFSGTFAASGALTLSTDGSGNVTLDVSDSGNGTDLSGVVGSDGTHYLQITSGVREGERFDILSGGVDSLTLVNDPDIFSESDGVRSLNTSHGLPADVDLNGASYEVIRYHTVDDRFDPETVYAGEEDIDPNDVMRLLFYNNRLDTPGYETLMLFGTSTADSKWIYGGDPFQTDQGDRRIGPGEGNWIHPRSSGDRANPSSTPPVRQLDYGMVAEHDQSYAMNEGYNLTGAMWPLDQTPAGPDGRDLMVAAGFLGGIDPSLSTELLFWTGDAVADDPGVSVYVEGYDNYMLLHGGGMQNWVDISDPVLRNLDAVLSLESHRAVFVKLLGGDQKAPHVYPQPGF